MRRASIECDQALYRHAAHTDRAAHLATLHYSAVVRKRVPYARWLARSRFVPEKSHSWRHAPRNHQEQRSIPVQRLDALHQADLCLARRDPTSDKPPHFSETSGECTCNARLLLRGLLYRAAYSVHPGMRVKSCLPSAVLSILSGLARRDYPIAKLKAQARSIAAYLKLVNSNHAALGINAEHLTQHVHDLLQSGVGFGRFQQTRHDVFSALRRLP